MTLVKLLALSPAAVKVYVLLAMRSKTHDDRLYRTDVATFLSRSVRTVSAGIRELVDHGFLVRTRRGRYTVQAVKP